MGGGASTIQIAQVLENERDVTWRVADVEVVVSSSTLLTPCLRISSFQTAYAILGAF